MIINVLIEIRRRVVQFSHFHGFAVHSVYFEYLGNVLFVSCKIDITVLISQRRSVSVNFFSVIGIVYRVQHSTLLPVHTVPAYLIAYHQISALLCIGKIRVNVIVIVCGYSRNQLALFNDLPVFQIAFSVRAGYRLGIIVYY